MSLRDKFIASVKENKFKNIPVPGIGTVKVKALRGFEMDIVQEGKTESERNARLVVMTALDPETDLPVFDEDCIEILARGNVAPLVPILNTARDLLYPTEEDAKKSIPDEKETGCV